MKFQKFSLVCITLLLLSSAFVWAGGEQEAAQGSAGDQELVFWHTFTQPVRIDFMKKAAAEFEKENNCKVKIEVVPWGKVDEKWITAQGANSLPDVMVGTPNNALAAWLAGASNPCDQVFEEMGGNDFFMPGVVDKFSKYDGQLVSLPFYAHTRLFLYRKDIFKEVGVTPPTNWKEFVDVTAALNNPPERYGFIQLWGPQDRGATLMLYTMLRSNGTSFFDQSGEPQFLKPEFIETVDFLIDLYKAGSPQGELSLSSHEATWPLFESGKTAIALDTLFAAGIFKTDRPELWEQGAFGVFAPPKNENSDREKGYFSDSPSLINTKGANDELAAKFMKFLYQTDRYVEFLLTIPAGQFPLTTDAAKSDAFWNHPLLSELQDGVEITLDGIEGAGTPFGMRYGLNNYASVVGTGMIEKMMANIILKGMDTKKAAALAQEELVQALEEIKKRM